MVIYIDSDYICYTEAAQGRRAFDVEFFDGKGKSYIEGYRYVPIGESWTRADGSTFAGEMIAPAKDYNRIMTDVAISYLDDDEAESVTPLFEDWQIGVAYEVGDRRQYNGFLYRCVQAHTSQADWTPDITPALWVRTWTDPFPEWIQPQGAHDAYRLGDKVSHLDKHWISDIDYNTYEPSVYGWSEVS